MTLNEFKEKLFAKASEEGFSEYEIYYKGGENLSIEVFKSEVSNYSLSKTAGICFRGLYKGNIGYAYTEVLDETSIELLIRDSKENSQIVEKKEEEIIFGGSDNYKVLDGYNEKINSISSKEKVKLALQLEKEAYDYSDKVVGTEYCVLDYEEEEKRIMNSKGLDLYYKSNGVIGFMAPITKDDDGISNTGFSFKATRNLEDFKIKDIAVEGVLEALQYAGAKSIKSGKYKVLLNNTVSSTLLETFGGVFSAENAQKGLSLLKGKVGEKIASPLVTIIDNPHIEDSLCSTPFDDEGVATYYKEVVLNGELKTLLHNLKTAKAEGVLSTGNGSKASVISPVEVAPSNFYIQQGEKSYEAMIKELEDGVIITEIQGMHSGANSITGDFSLAAKGFLVKGGSIERAVEQITIAGNFFTLLKNVIEVGGDFKFFIPSEGSCYGSPSILIKELSIAGE